MPGTAAVKKTYRLEGRVLNVYDPRTVKTKWGSSECSDMNLQLKSGTKVRVSFWNQDIAGYEGATVLISACTFGGDYKGTPQYATTKNTEVQVLKAGKAAAKPEAEAEQEEATPEVAEPETPGEVEAEETGDADPEPAPAPKTVAKKTTVKKAAKTAAATAPATYVVHPDAVAEITALAAEANRIANYTADPTIKADPKALQGWASTIFINLGTKNFYANGGRNGS